MDFYCTDEFTVRLSNRHPLPWDGLNSCIRPLTWSIYTAPAQTILRPLSSAVIFKIFGFYILSLSIEPKATVIPRHNGFVSLGIYFVFSIQLLLFNQHVTQC